MNTEFERCVKKLAVAATCLALLDFTVGGASRFAFDQQRSGKWYRIHRTMTSANQRLWVFGSSHAASHYVPAVLKEVTGLSSYNAGVLGQQVLFHETLESIVLERLTPEVVVLDVDPSTLYANPDTYARLSDLKPFYHRYPLIIGPVLERRSLWERLFLHSRLYQYNSTLAHVVRYWLAPQPDYDGYRPEYARMTRPTQDQERRELEASRAFREQRALDPVMMASLNRFATSAARRGSLVFFFVSPGALPYDMEGNESLREAEATAKRLGVLFCNFRNHREFLRKYELFADSGHLNDEGARRYSRLVAEVIRRTLAGNATHAPRSAISEDYQPARAASTQYR